MDKLHLEPLDGDNQNLTAVQRNNARRNAMQIESNIMKLIRIFKREDLQAKLKREFKDVINRPGGSDIANFNATFADMRSLYVTKLCTSLEESLRMQQQVETSTKRVAELNKTLKDKDEQLEKFQKNAKELKTARMLEIDSLKQAKSELKSQANAEETTLKLKGKDRKENKDKEHEDTLNYLRSQLSNLDVELLEVQKTNKAEEESLLKKFEATDGAYKEALLNYD